MFRDSSRRRESPPTIIRFSNSHDVGILVRCLSATSNPKMGIGPYFQRCRTGLYAAAGFASVGVRFHRAASTAPTFSSQHIPRVFYPLNRYWAESVFHGEFPPSFPYAALGQPFT